MPSFKSWIASAAYLSIYFRVSRTNVTKRQKILIKCVPNNYIYLTLLHLDKQKQATSFIKYSVEEKYGPVPNDALKPLSS